MKKKKKICAVVGCLHAGSTVGLCPAENSIMLDDGGHYEPSSYQKEIWKHWVEFWRTTKQIATEENSEVVMVFLGDIMDGNHHQTTQIVSSNIAATQMMIAQECIDKAINTLGGAMSSMVFIRGTEAHAGKSGQYEEALARLYEKAVEVNGKKSHWGLTINMGNISIDLAHHGRIGQRAWTKLSGPASIGAETIIHCSIARQNVPDYVIRGHYHQWADTGDTFPKPRVIQIPSWQIPTAYVHRISPINYTRISVGGVIISEQSGARKVGGEVEYSTSISL